MKNHHIFTLPSALALSMTGTAAQAEPGDTFSIAGSSQAEVVETAALAKVDDLRFGRFFAPSANAQLTVSTNGTATGTGEIATSMNITQPAEGRGPASFIVNGDPNRLFLGFTPNQMNISNGSSTMQVLNMTDNLGGLFGLLGQLNANGQFDLKIGGTLRVNADQEPGYYTGDFQVTVLYL